VNSPRRTHAIADLLVVASLLASGAASAQTFDLPRYESLREECASFLRAAVAAQAAGDQGRALVYHDLGSESCDQAAAIVRDSAGSLSEREAARVFAAGEDLDAELGEALLALGDCAGADELLRASASLRGALSPDAAVAHARVYHQLWTCLGGEAGAAARVEVRAQTDLVMLEGSALGEVAAESVVYGCRGWLPESPGLVVEVLEPTWLSLVVVGGDSQTILAGIDGPGGSYCAYGAPSTNVAAYERDVLPGTYRVYVGQIAPPIARTPVTFSVQSVDTAALRAAPILGSHDVDAATPARSRAGVMEAYQSAASVAPGCEGFVADTPTIELRLAEEGPIWLAVTTKGPDPARVVLEGEGRSLCQGAPSGSGPAILAERLPAGRYRALVVTASSAPTPYVVTFGATAPTPADAAALGGPADATLGTTAGLAAYALEAYGTRDAAALFGGSCVGLIGDQPDLRVDIAEAGVYAFMATPEEAGDLTLVVAGPSGVWCGDDFAGENPGLFLELEPGRYGVYIGNWGRGGEVRLEIGSAY
jgi:hypothetical protein